MRSSGAQSGAELRDSGLDVSYALRAVAIEEKRQSWKNATDNNFSVGTYEELIPSADLVINLTPDKQHSPVVSAVMPLMKEGACLSYSHGFNIVEVGMEIRKDITVVMVAPKSPERKSVKNTREGSEFLPCLRYTAKTIPKARGWDIAKAYCCGTGGDRAGALQSSFIAEVKSDLMGEQTILCGMLQGGVYPLL